MAPSIWNLIIGLVTFLSNSRPTLSMLDLGNSASCYKPPQICPNSNITYHLFNRNIKNRNGYELKIDDPNSLDRAPFTRFKPVIFISHGYTGHLHMSPNPELIDAYRRIQKDEPYNLIALDWGRLCPAPCYTQSAHNVALVGNCTAQFIEVLLQHQTWFVLKDIHFVGFSLGAQVAGQVARRLTIGKLEWITALDPAFPLFDTLTTGDEERLDTNDANFLEVYHTNAGYKGQPKAIGHVDFFANHLFTQPGCGTDSSCNHRRAVLYYAESIYSKTGFYAYQCLSVITHLIGFCSPSDSDDYVLIGHRINHTLRGRWYFRTNEHYPFAKGRPQ